MADNLEEIIREIAVKHGVAVGIDDPILILHTLNNFLMKEASANQAELLGRFKEELEDIANSWGENGKKMAERTLTAALNASRDTMNQTMQEGAKAAANVMSQEVAEVVNQLAAPLRESKRIAFMNLGAAGMVLFAALMALAASLIG